MISDERFLKMLEAKIFGIECCRNINCLYNMSHYRLEGSFLTTKQSSPTTSASPSDEAWKQYNKYSIDNDPRSQLNKNFHKLRILANPLL